MAKTSGRRSAADLNAAQFIKAIQPTRTLSAFESRVWDLAVASWPVDHWIGTDTEILMQYCAVCKAFEDARKSGDIGAMDKAGRLCLTYATKLRITPQARYEARQTAREASNGRANEAAATSRLLGGSAWTSATPN
jgi:hypothetical protein